MNTHKLMLAALWVAVVMIVGLPVFWIAGGVSWVKHFLPPKRPVRMPTSSVWIEDPSSPFAWHRGWWFGCTVSASGKTNHCQLITGEEEEVYAGDYLPCGGKKPVSVENLKLGVPLNPSQMWVQVEKDWAAAGFLEDGKILLPVGALAQCAVLTKKFYPLRGGNQTE